MTQPQFLHQIADWLDAAGIPFMLAGSYGSSTHGQPRTTIDIDLVIDPTLAQLEAFLALLGERYYVSAEGARDALAQRSIFNIIDFDEGWKADLIIRKDRPFSIEEFRRRRVASVQCRDIPLVSPEDAILSKLEWNKITTSERQVRDALSVAQVQRSKLDLPYLRNWAAILEVADKLEEILREAGAGKSG